ncbi:MAG: hypothetical protein KF690_05450 [Bacteroidetes bacterium]|nr:hypothetical protein [Bacteroidota bacterium]
MKPLTEIHELIHSLTGSEKRYISSFIKPNSVNGQLFQYLMRTPFPVDADQARDDLGYRDNYPGFLRITRYLEERVLALIKQYDRKNSINALLTDAIQDVEALYARGFYDRADKIIIQAKKQAQKVERLEMLLELLRWQHKLIVNSYELDKQIPALRQVYDEQQEVANKLRNLYEYMLLEEEVLLRFRRDYFSREESHKITLDNELVHDEVKPHSLRAQCLYHVIRGLTFFYNDEMDRAEAEYYKLDLISNRHLFLKTVYLEDYLTAMLSWVRVKYWRGHLESAQKLISKIQNSQLIEDLPQARRSQYYQLLYNYQFIIYEDQRQLEKARDMIPTIIDLLEHGKVDPLAKDVFYYNFAIIHFDLHDSGIARHYIKAILQKNPKQVRDDIYVFAQILELLILYDAQEWDTLDYRIKSTYRFLKKRKRIYKLESLIMDFIRQLPKAKTRPKLIELLRKLRDQIELLKSEQFEQKATRYYNFTGWLDGRIKTLESSTR